MGNRLDQPNELPLISGELGMPQRQLATEENHRSTALMEHNAQARVGHIAFHDEVAVEVWELQDWCHGEHTLQRPERRFRLRAPLERVYLEQRRQRRGDGVVILDEVVVVPCQAQERPDGAHGSWQRLVQHGPDLLLIHRDTIRRDDVPKIRH
jgi:hypothetical protein